MAYYGSISVNVDVDVDIDEVLDQMDTEDIRKYLEEQDKYTRIGERYPIIIGDFVTGDLEDALVEDYFKGGFSEFNWTRFFERINKS